jgi:hypothetical protein
LATEVGSDAGISNVVITSGSLPSGVTQAGVFGWVTGTPNNGGPYNFTATFYPYADQTNVTSRVFNYSGTVGPSNIPILVMTPGGSSYNLTQGTAYNWTSGNPSNNAPVLCGVYLTMTGSPRFYSPPYSLNSGSLPPGMTLQVMNDFINNGYALALIGTPTAVGTYTANLTFWNTHTYQTQTYTFVVDPGVTAPVLSGVSNPTASSGTVNIITLSAGTAPITISGSADGTPFSSLPYTRSVRLSDAGKVFSATASNSAGSDSISITLNPQPGPFSIPSSLSSVYRNVGQTYSNTLSSSSFPNVPVGSMTASGLPPGLSISGATVSGTFTTAGTYNVTFTLYPAPDYTNITSVSTTQQFVIT